MRENDPAGFADAVEFDLLIRQVDQEGATEKFGHLKGLPFLHRSCKPLGEVVFVPTGEASHLVGIAGNECQGMCGV